MVGGVALMAKEERRERAAANNKLERHFKKIGMKPPTTPPTSSQRPPSSIPVCSHVIFHSHPYPEHILSHIIQCHSTVLCILVGIDP